MPQKTNSDRRGKDAAPARSLAFWRREAPIAVKRPKPGRYTPPIPREVRHSPKWYPWMLLGLLLAGVAVIILNYIAALPHSPTNWYTLGGLIAIVFGALLATRYH